jgi:hypothetical protein
MLEATLSQDRPTYVLDRIDRLIPGQMWKDLGWSEDNG